MRIAVRAIENTGLFENAGKFCFRYWLASFHYPTGQPQPSGDDGERERFIAAVEAGLADVGPVVSTRMPKS